MYIKGTVLSLRSLRGACHLNLGVVSVRLLRIVNQLTNYVLLLTAVTRDSVVAIATSYWLGDRGVGVIFSPHVVQNDSGVYPTPYLMCTGSFPGGKAARA
jgi:hypothetical protein